MSEETLKKAVQIQEKISEIEKFIYTLERTPKSSLFIKTEKRLFFKAKTFGSTASKEIDLDFFLENEISILLKRKLEDLKKELENL